MSKPSKTTKTEHQTQETADQSEAPQSTGEQSATAPTAADYLEAQFAAAIIVHATEEDVEILEAMLRDRPLSNSPEATTAESESHRPPSEQAAEPDSTAEAAERPSVPQVLQEQIRNVVADMSHPNREHNAPSEDEQIAARVMHNKRWTEQRALKEKKSS